MEYEKTLELEPTNPRAAVDLGQLLMRQGRYEEARRFCDRIVRLQPRNVEPRILLAEALASLGRLPEARAECEQAVAADPHSGRALGMLALLSAAAKDTSAAIESLRRATAVEPELPGPHFHLGTLLAASATRDPERLAEAEMHLRSAIVLSPGLPNAHLQLFGVLIRRGNAAGIVAFVDSAHAKGRATGDLDFAAGWVLRKSGHVSEAIHVLTAGHRDFPTHLDVTNALAWYLATAPRADLRDPGLALTLAADASHLAREPSPYVLDTEAAALAANGRFAQAADAASSAVRLARERRDFALAREIEARVRLYRDGRPFIDQ